MEYDNVKLKIIIAAALIICGVVGRFVLVSYAGIPNLEIITALTLIAGIYLGGVYSVAIPLSIIFLSDLVIGNNYIFIFTWTAFVLIGLLGYSYNKNNKKFRSSRDNDSSISTNKQELRNSVYLAIIASVFFYLFTNFGWWLMSGMYEYSLSGLFNCYYIALPFFRNNLIGNLIFVPFSIAVFSKVMHSLEYKNKAVVKPKTEIF